MLKLLSHPVKNILTSFVGVLGISSLIVFPAAAQQLGTNRVNPIQPVAPIYPVNFTNRINNPIPPAQNGAVLGERGNYPYGSRLEQNGTISTPQGGTTVPNVTINRGDGSTSYYYPDGSRVDVNNNSVPASGKLLR